jgi:hypothetical protein
MWIDLVSIGVHLWHFWCIFSHLRVKLFRFFSSFSIEIVRSTLFCFLLFTRQRRKNALLHSRDFAHFKFTFLRENKQKFRELSRVHFSIVWKCTNNNCEKIFVKSPQRRSNAKCNQRKISDLINELTSANGLLNRHPGSPPYRVKSSREMRKCF